MRRILVRASSGTKMISIDKAEGLYLKHGKDKDCLILFQFESGYRQLFVIEGGVIRNARVFPPSDWTHLWNHVEKFIPEVVRTYIGFKVYDEAFDKIVKI